MLRKIMPESSIKHRLQEDIKQAMRDRDQQKLTAIRFIMAAVKQREVDERILLDDTQVIAILEKSVKQRKDSIEQFQSAGRDELAAKEQFELELIKTYLPEALSDEEVEMIIKDAIKSSGAESVRDMGKVMGIVKPKLQGRADMSVVSAKIKTLLS
jgi:hypothetical protein